MFRCYTPSGNKMYNLKNMCVCVCMYVCMHRNIVRIVLPGDDL